MAEDLEIPTVDAPEAPKPPTVPGKGTFGRNMKAKGLKAMRYVTRNTGDLIGKAFGGLGVLSVAGDLGEHLSRFTDKVFKSRPMNGVGNSLEHIDNLGGLGDVQFKFSSKRGTSQMRTLKDALVAKIAAAKNPAVREDVAFITKISGAAVQALRTKMASRTQKTAGFMDQIGSGMGQIASRSVEAMGKAPKFMEGMGSSMMPMLQAGSLATVGALGAGAVYDKIKTWLKVQDSYTKMFQEFPELNEAPREQVDKYWTVLSDFAPILTTNPLVAGQFINNMLNYGVKGVDHIVAGQLLDIQNRGRQVSGLGDALSAVNQIARPAFEATMSPDQHQMLMQQAQGQQYDVTQQAPAPANNYGPFGAGSW